MISLIDISKSYHDADRELSIISGLTFDFPKSGTVAIVGRSGIGKSTLLHMMGGLDRPTSGKVLVNEVDLGSLSQNESAKFRAKNLGFVFQSHHLLPEFTAVENTAMPLLVQELDRGEALKRAEQMLNTVGLSERSSHRPSRLSGGEQQRVAIARALVTRPAVILADEPTGNLDPTTGAKAQELIIGLQRDLKNLLVIVTHNRELASSMEHVLEMQPGGRLERIT